MSLMGRTGLDNVVAMFPRRARREGWSTQERAELYRVEAALVRLGIPVEVEEGVTDEGDPWLAFCHAETADVVAHFARVDDGFVAMSPTLAEPLVSRSFAELVRRMGESMPVTVSSRNGQNLLVHPAAMLVAGVATMFLKMTPVEGEGDPNREAARSLAASGASGSGAPGGSMTVEAYVLAVATALALAAESMIDMPEEAEFWDHVASLLMTEKPIPEDEIAQAEAAIDEIVSDEAAIALAAAVAKARAVEAVRADAVDVPDMEAAAVKDGGAHLVGDIALRETNAQDATQSRSSEEGAAAKAVKAGTVAAAKTSKTSKAVSEESEGQMSVSKTSDAGADGGPQGGTSAPSKTLLQSTDDVRVAELQPDMADETSETSRGMSDTAPKAETATLILADAFELVFDNAADASDGVAISEAEEVLWQLADEEDGVEIEDLDELDVQLASLITEAFDFEDAPLSQTVSGPLLRSVTADLADTGAATSVTTGMLDMASDGILDPVAQVGAPPATRDGASDVPDADDGPMETDVALTDVALRVAHPTIDEGPSDDLDPASDATALAMMQIGTALQAIGSYDVVMSDTHMILVDQRIGQWSEAPGFMESWTFEDGSSVNILGLAPIDMDALMVA